MEEKGFLILYGSHTGQAEAISRQLMDRVHSLGLRARVCGMQQAEVQLENESLIVFICSSTGDGEPPDNATRFARRIARLPDRHLVGLSFALLGLGDSNFSTFQGFPRRVETQLLRLGARKFVATGAADDQVGLELVVEPWLDVLVAKLQETRVHRDEIVTSTCEVAQLNLNTDRIHDKSPREMDSSEEDQVVERVLVAEPANYPADRASLVRGSEQLRQEQDLRVPVPALSYLVSAVTHEKCETWDDLAWQNGQSLVGSLGGIRAARVVAIAELTEEHAVKPKREIQIRFDESNDQLEYAPGDAFYFIVPNPRAEVNFILDRMGLLVLADQKCRVAIDPGSRRPNPTLPGHIPANGASLRYLFTHCLDIRRAPGRPLLRVLAESTSNADERRRLLELCSAQGVNDFTQFVRQAGLSLVDVLLAFPSCRPEVDRLIEHLPRLLPRPYSVASIPQRFGIRRVRFVYSMMQFPAEDGRRYARYGLCSQWLTGLRVGDRVQVILKEPSRFRLPPPSASATIRVSRMPLLMIGPGAGVAPFLAFLQRILVEEEEEGKEKATGVTRWLLFGCRRLDVDCIYRHEMEDYKRMGLLTQLTICESMPEMKSDKERDVYVQDALRRDAHKVVQFLNARGPHGEASRIFVCGDARGMSKDVWNCFVHIVREGMGKSEEEANEFLMQLKTEERYIEDVWA